jgi:cytochrome b involved in lipid metabolism
MSKGTEKSGGGGTLVSRSLSSDDLCKLVERKLEKKGALRRVTKEELGLHNHDTDGWIACGGKVYDITKHIADLQAAAMGKTSTLLAISRVLGTDCTEEMITVHSDSAMKMLQGYMIGVLDPTTPN